MRYARLSIALAASLALPIAASPCELSPSVLEVYHHVTTATASEWKASRQSLNRLLSETCADGPRSAVSRDVLFRAVAQEMTLDYKQVFAAWAQQDGTPPAEGSAEGIAMFQRDLLDYLDRIVTPNDLPRKDIILAYANGQAIARLGKSVKRDVFKQAGTPPKRLSGLVQHDAQAEAMRAIGYWLVPTDATLTVSEKRQFALFVAGALPPDGVVLGGSHTRAVTAILEALGRSDVPEVEEKLRDWRHLYENRNGTGDTISRIAQESADRVRQRRR
jgi:hypothetical protein